MTNLCKVTSQFVDRIAKNDQQCYSSGSVVSPRFSTSVVTVSFSGAVAVGCLRLRPTVGLCAHSEPISVPEPALPPREFEPLVPVLGALDLTLELEPFPPFTGVKRNVGSRQADESITIREVFIFKFGKVDM